MSLLYTPSDDGKAILTLRSAGLGDGILIGGNKNIQEKFEHVKDNLSLESRNKICMFTVDIHTGKIKITTINIELLYSIEIDFSDDNYWAVIIWSKVDPTYHTFKEFSMKISDNKNNQCINEINSLLISVETTLRANTSIVYALDRLTDQLLKIN
jgi:hypothetical protein